MGCVFSSIDEEEKVRICKERKKLMKQLVGIRGEFSDSQLAYLKALRNTGATLRQFTESEALDLESSSTCLSGPPSPPLYLPPSPPPPPPPPFSLDKNKSKVDEGESTDIDEENVNRMPIHFNLVDILNYPFPSSPHHREIQDTLFEGEKWEETRTEFEDENLEAETAESIVVNPRSEKQQSTEAVDDSSSAMSLYRKDTTDIPVMVGRTKKTLEGIVKELDDYFLKASKLVKEIAILIDANGGDILLRQNSGHQKRKRSNSTKVFSVLSWSWYSKPPQCTRDAAEISGTREPSRPGAHCITLEKLYTAEKRLCKEIKEEEITKMEYERKSLILQKLEAENHDWIKIDKTRLSLESLESDIIRLQQSISQTTSSILELIDEELYPQLVALTSGLTQMWSTMHKCHQAQVHISQQLSYLCDNQYKLLNSEYHHQATVQLETEVNYWFNSFCKLVKSQRDYVRTLSRWIQLTNHLMDEQSGCSSMIRSICEKWELGLDGLPDKMASDAIKSFLSSIHSLIIQQAEEDNLLKRVEKLERRFLKELNSLEEMEKKIEWSFDPEDAPVNLSPKHPLSLKRTKTDALKRQMESEKAKYLDSVQVCRVMTLNNLKTRLPQVFQSLMTFSSAYTQVIEVVYGQDKPADCSDIGSQN